MPDRYPRQPREPNPLQEHLDAFTAAVDAGDDHAARQAAGRYLRANTLAILENVNPALKHVQQTDAKYMPIATGRALAQLVGTLSVNILQAASLLLADTLTTEQLDPDHTNLDTGLDQHDTQEEQP